MDAKIRPELGLVTKNHETSDIDDAAAMLNQGGWVIIAAAKGEDGYLFSLGYMEINTDHCWAVGQYYLPPKNQ